MRRYKITTWHGEHGSVYYIIDLLAPQAKQPAIIAAFDNLETARFHLSKLQTQEHETIIQKPY
jgi:hypothetical protein